MQNKEGRVTIFVMPAGSRIYLNDKFVGHSPVDLRYPVGIYKGRGEIQGYKTTEFRIEVIAEFPPKEYVFILEEE